MSWKRNRVAISFPDPSLAIQSQKDEADINKLVRDFGVTGRMPASTRLPTYGDFEGVDDYQSAVHAVREADAAFLAVPSSIRREFNNDPQAFIDFCSQPENLPKLQEWGLAPVPAGSARTDNPPN